MDPSAAEEYEDCSWISCPCEADATDKCVVCGRREEVERETEADAQIRDATRVTSNPHLFAGQMHTYVEKEEEKGEVGGVVNEVDPTLAAPSEGSQMRLSATQVQPYSPQGFRDRYPNAPVISGRHDMTQIPIGYIVDFSEADPNITKASHPISINGSCLIMGKAKMVTPVSTINNDLMIRANENDIVVFENILFDGRGASGGCAVNCASGNIVFRSCTFINRKTALTVGYDGLKSVRVRFEECAFCNIVQCAVSVEYRYVYIIDCRFNTCGLCVAVGSDTFANVRNSTFTDCVGGVLVLGRGRAEVFDCHFLRMLDFCVFASDAAILNTRSCKAIDCKGSCVTIEGRATTEARVKKWTFCDCHICVRIGNGKVDVLLELLSFQECTIGIYITPDAKGEICMVVMNEEYLVDLSGPKCSVYIWDDDDYIWDDEDAVRAPQYNRLHASRELLTAHGIKYGYPVSARTRKILTEAGIMDMVCAMCKAVAPKDNVFKKCARCSQARYCSRACQESHWCDHRAQCHVHNLRADMLVDWGFVACHKCGTVESRTTGVQHNACSNCRHVFYCNRDCQRVDWPEHKKLCNFTAKREK